MVRGKISLILFFLLLVFVANMSPTHDSKREDYILGPVFANLPLAGITAVRNTITIQSFTVTSSGQPCPDFPSNQCFSIQQNFQVITPSSYPVASKTVQNTIGIEFDAFGQLKASADFEVWDPTTTPPHIVQCLSISCGGESESNFVLGTTLTINSAIDPTGKLLMTNSFDSTGSTYSFPQGSVISSAEIIIVGHGSGLLGTGSATFQNFDAVMDASIQLSGMTGWQVPGRIGVEQQSNFGSTETSKNLKMTLNSNTALVSYQLGGADEGVAFYPAPPKAAIAQPPQFVSPIAVGQDVTFTAFVMNKGDSAYWMTIQVEFPGITDASVVQSTSFDGSTSNVPCSQGSQANCVFPSGASVTSNYGTSSAVLNYLMVEVTVLAWKAGQTHSLAVTVRPPTTGLFKVRVKSIVSSYAQFGQVDQYNSDPAVNSVPPPPEELDAQNESAYAYTIQINPAPTYSLQVLSSPQSGVSIGYSINSGGLTFATTSFTLSQSSTFSVYLNAPTSDPSGDLFQYWLLNGVNQGSTNSITVSVDSFNPSQSAVAVYQSQGQYVVHVISQPIQGIQIACSGCSGGTTNFDVTGSGLTATLTAPSTFNGYTFSSWVWNGVSQGSSTSLTVTVDATHNGWYAIAEYSQPAYTTTWTTVLSTTYTTSVSYTVTTSTSLVTSTLGTVSTTTYVSGSIWLAGAADVLVYMSTVFVFVAFAPRFARKGLGATARLVGSKYRPFRGLRLRILRAGVVVLLAFSIVQVAVPTISIATHPQLSIGPWNFSVMLCNSAADCPSGSNTRTIFPTDRTNYIVRVTALSEPSGGNPSVDVSLILKPDGGYPTCRSGPGSVHFGPSDPTVQDVGFYFSGAQGDCSPSTPIPTGTYNFYVQAFWSYSGCQGCSSSPSNMMTLIVAWAGTITNTVYSAVTSTVPSVSTIVVGQTSTMYVVATSVYTSTLPQTSTITLPTTQVSTLYSVVATSTSTSYTSTYTSVSTVPFVTTVVLVPVTATVQSIQYQTSFVTTTVTNYSSTSTSVSTIPTLTTVTIGPPTSTIQTTRLVSSTGTATVTGVTTTTITSYTGTQTSSSTTIVVTTVTTKSSFFGESLLALLGVLGLAVRFGVEAEKGRVIPKVLLRLGRRCLRS